MVEEKKKSLDSNISFEDFKDEVLTDYRLACESREASLLGRKEVLTGKAKFGIFGDGKEVAQLALAKTFQKGDFRAGYYRDQTLAFATGMVTLKQYFSQLYANPSTDHDPASGGRMMNSHFSTRLLDANGKWVDHLKQANSAADLSPVASQMLKLTGLGYASKLYRLNEDLHDYKQFSDKGNEVAFGTIGDASTAEGMFYETINALGILGGAAAISIWDDNYGISVPVDYQVTKKDISEVLKGFEYDEKSKQGFKIYKVKGWNYPELVKAYKECIDSVRNEHIPAIIHVEELTQPQGHSTSGSHERYKSKKRLEWEKEMDCNKQMRKWILESALATEEELEKIEKEAKETVRTAQKEAWEECVNPIKQEKQEVAGILEKMAGESKNADQLQEAAKNLKSALDFNRKTVMKGVYQGLRLTIGEDIDAKNELVKWKKEADRLNHKRFNSHLYSEHEDSALHVEEVKPKYDEDAKEVDGREVMLAFFDQLFGRDSRVLVFGEDVGHIGDVNQGLAGMQEKYGELRVMDTGIREATIIGQGIGLAMRGLRPIAEIQYLDYLLYGLQILSDDLASLRYRSADGQKAPLIVRTRGHRLEGIWHSGSLMGTYLNAFRGLHLCVPRNMTQAAGFYNTLMKAEEPGVIVERLNAYRLKEKLPSNLDEMTVPLGVPEILREGEDISIVTYGACVDIAKEAIAQLEETGISCELIDIQTLLPFDRPGIINDSLKKTNRVLFLDEDVPGGATAYMMQQALDIQKGYYHLDSEPKALPAQAHRPPYGTDGDYFSKPNAEEVFREVYEIMNEADPEKYPALY